MSYKTPEELHPTTWFPFLFFPAQPHAAATLRLSRRTRVAQKSLPRRFITMILRRNDKKRFIPQFFCSLRFSHSVCSNAGCVKRREEILDYWPILNLARSRLWSRWMDIQISDNVALRLNQHYLTIYNQSTHYLFISHSISVHPSIYLHYSSFIPSFLHLSFQMSHLQTNEANKRLHPIM